MHITHFEKNKIYKGYGSHRSMALEPRNGSWHCPAVTAIKQFYDHVNMGSCEGPAVICTVSQLCKSFCGK